jgi:hypothetical protein
MKIAKSAILLVALLSAPIAAASLTSEEIVQLTKMGLGDDAIIAKIKADSATFDLSTDQMLDLKSKGVSSAVIAAMITTGIPDTASEMSVDSPDPNVPHPAGVYLLQTGKNDQRMLRIDATGSSQMKTGGIFGYALTGGLASMSMKVSIPGSSARAKTVSARPTFYFFFDQSQQGAAASSFLASTYLGGSPAEFNLVKLKSNKNMREAKVGKVNIGGAKMGVMDEDRIEFDYDMVRSGVYRVTTKQNLGPGEYGFLYSVGGGQAGAAGARIFDFAIE